MNAFLTSNKWYYRLLRTIVQAAIGILIANVDAIVGQFSFDPTMKPVIVGLVMSVLSPVMAMVGDVDAKDLAEGA